MAGRRRARRRPRAVAPAVCAACGQPHGLLSFAIPVNAPTEVAAIPPAERADRVWNDSDLCVVDDERYYVYGSIDVRVHGHEGPFTWGAWVRVDQDTFDWFNDEFYYGDADDPTHPPFRATLATDIPFYPPTLDLPVTVQVQPKGLRPLFELEAMDHPLARDHRDGVAPERIGQIRAWFEALRRGR